MRAPLLLARTWARQGSRCHIQFNQFNQFNLRSAVSDTLSPCRRTFSLNPAPRGYRSWGQPPPPLKGGRPLLWGAAAALSPAALLELSEPNDDQEDDGKTGEQHMLEASRAELAQQAPSWVGSSTRFRRGIWRFLDTWIIEPIATGFRFLHLVFIFVPVVVTIPMLWVGSRDQKRDGERWGTVWWYGFLVSSMERAGAAFIKVRTCMLGHVKRLQETDISIFSWANGLHHEPTSFLTSFAPSCHHCIQTLQHTVSRSPRRPLKEPLKCPLTIFLKNLTRSL